MTASLIEHPSPLGVGGESERERERILPLKKKFINEKREREDVFRLLANFREIDASSIDKESYQTYENKMKTQHVSS